MDELAGLTVDHEEGRRELGSILERLRKRQSEFDAELGLLDENAEWDKFTVAFFGETNAGKSTLIESMRILFKEEAREELLASNAGNLERRRSLLADQVERVRTGLRQAFASHARELMELRSSASALTLIVQQESIGRVRHRLRKFVAAAFVGGVLVGAVIAAAIVLVRHA